MGEKIRDLHTIKIGNSQLMIELNEGYSKDEGRLIHIQNEHFRYLLKEKHFLNLASVVLRSKREMEYSKSEFTINKIKSRPVEWTEAEKNVVSTKIEVCKLLSNNEIDYRIISEGSKFITILIKENDRRTCIDVINKTKGYSFIEHPYSENSGYIFLYQMHPFKLVSYGDTLIELYFQLPCQSLTEKTWIPLDRAIQKHVWENKIVGDNEIYYLDYKAKVIFLLTWSIFTTRFFSKKTIEIIESEKSILLEEETKRLLDKVFFNFTDTLINLIIAGRYTDIFFRYYQFSDY